MPEPRSPYPPPRISVVSDVGEIELGDAVVECSRLLLGESSEAPVNTALDLLITAAAVDTAYVSRKHDDEEFGPSSWVVNRSVREAYQHFPGAQYPGSPYSDLPSAFDALSVGGVAIVDPSSLTPEQAPIYEGTTAEITIPIISAGNWIGSITLENFETAHRWDDGEVALLRVVGEMIGAFWARQDDREAIRHRLALEQALTESAQSLLDGEEDAIDITLAHLGTALGVQLGFLARNETIDGEPFTRTTHVWSPSGRMTPAAMWFGPHSATPSLTAQLAEGVPGIVHARDLRGTERAIFEAENNASEVSFAVLVNGVWEGTVGFASSTHREWTEQDVTFLKTAARLVGAYLEGLQVKDRLTDLIRAKDDFVASISHEIRTPLTSVLGFAELLARAEPSEVEQDEFLRLIVREAREMAWIVEDLLVAARADINTLEISTRPFSARQQVATVLEVQRGTTEKTIPIEGTDAPVLGDPQRTRQIIRNLLTNAQRYGGPDIRCGIERAARTVDLLVSDDGPGIDEERAELIFLPYERAHEALGQPGSIGLGLSVSRQLALLMNGDLTYERAEGRTIFRLRLPSP